jgi:rubrerythrin
MDEAIEKRLPRPEDLSAMSAECLRAAFAGESQAAEKYMVFAEQAEDEGYPNIARLFHAISFAESRHARNHLRVLGGIRTTAENLQAALEGEKFEIDEMYPAYGEIAKLQAHAQATRSMSYAIKAEMGHRDMYGDAHDSAMGEADIAVEAVSVCLVCGHTVIGRLPERCPVCAAAKDCYRAF